MLEIIDFWSGAAKNVYQEDMRGLNSIVRRLYRRTLEMPGMVGCLSISWSFEGCQKVISGKIELFRG